MVNSTEDLGEERDTDEEREETDPSRFPWRCHGGYDLSGDWEWSDRYSAFLERGFRATAYLYSISAHRHRQPSGRRGILTATVSFRISRDSTAEIEIGRARGPTWRALEDAVMSAIQAFEAKPTRVRGVWRHLAYAQVETFFQRAADGGLSPFVTVLGGTCLSGWRAEGSLLPCGEYLSAKRDGCGRVEWATHSIGVGSYVGGGWLRPGGKVSMTPLVSFPPQQTPYRAFEQIDYPARRRRRACPPCAGGKARR